MLAGMALLGSNDPTHVVDGGLERSVLPDANRRPALRRQCGINGAISHDVAVQLWRPVPLVDLRRPSMLGADMPEAAVYEDRHVPGGEDDVWSDAEAAELQHEVGAEAVSETMQCRPEVELGSSITSSVALHRLSYTRPGCSRCLHEPTVGHPPSGVWPRRSLVRSN